MLAAKHALASEDRRFRGTSTRTIDRDLTDAGEEDLGEEALDARAGEVVALGQKGDRSWRDQGQEEGVREGQVITRQDRWTLGRQVLQALDPRAEKDAQHRADDEVLEEPVDTPRAVLGVTPGRGGRRYVRVGIRGHDGWQTSGPRHLKES